MKTNKIIKLNLLYTVRHFEQHYNEVNIAMSVFQNRSASTLLTCCVMFFGFSV